jgi:hypothetical protein
MGDPSGATDLPGEREKKHQCRWKKRVWFLHIKKTYEVVRSDATPHQGIPRPRRSPSGTLKGRRKKKGAKKGAPTAAKVQATHKKEQLSCVKEIVCFDGSMPRLILEHAFVCLCSDAAKFRPKELRTGLNHPLLLKLQICKFGSFTLMG